MFKVLTNFEGEVKIETTQGTGGTQEFMFNDDAVLKRIKEKTRIVNSIKKADKELVKIIDKYFDSSYRSHGGLNESKIFN